MLSNHVIFGLPFFLVPDKSVLNCVFVIKQFWRDQNIVACWSFSLIASIDFLKLRLSREPSYLFSLLSTIPGEAVVVLSSRTLLRVIRRICFVNIRPSK